MAKFSYKDGCLLCNQCGQLYESTQHDSTGKFECPCGNAEDLAAIHQIIEFYNRAAADVPPDPTEPTSSSDE